MRRTLFVAAVAASTISCGSSDKPATGGNNAANNSPTNSDTTQVVENNAPVGALTYWKDLRPLMDTHCIDCHDGQGVAPYDFTDPNEVAGLGELIKVQVENRIMPPWYPEDEQCAPLQGDPRLNDEGIQMFTDWVEGGKWVGDEANYVPGEVIPADIGVERLENDEVIELVPTAPYSVPTTVSDDFRCFTIDPHFETTRYVSGYEVDVDNADVLHHMVLFAIPGNNTATLNELEAEDPEPGFSCFGAPGVSDLALVGAWAPGGGRVGFPSQTALPLEAGTKFVMQMHYNLDNGGGVDQSRVKVWVMPEGQKPIGEATELFLGNLPFTIPAGVSGLDVPDEDCEVIYSLGDGMAPPKRGTRVGEGTVGSNGCVTQEFYYTSPVAPRLWSAFPHMHLVGQQIRVEVEAVEEQDGFSVPKPDSNDCLMNVPRWDFNWQRAYWFEEALRVPRKGVVRLTCRYDNTDGSGPISLGDGSGDEMCLALLYLSL